MYVGYHDNPPYKARMVDTDSDKRVHAIDPLYVPHNSAARNGHLACRQDDRVRGTRTKSPWQLVERHS
jgi:hypothetical protein